MANWAWVLLAILLFTVLVLGLAGTAMTKDTSRPLTATVTSSGMLF